MGPKEATAPRAPARAGCSSPLAGRSGRPVARQPRPASQRFWREPAPPRPIKTSGGRGRVVLPSEDAAEERRIEAFGGRKPSLNFPHGYFVL